jgi:hypothetical protein
MQKPPKEARARERNECGQQAYAVREADCPHVRQGRYDRVSQHRETAFPCYRKRSAQPPLDVTVRSDTF